MGEKIEIAWLQKIRNPKMGSFANKQNLRMPQLLPNAPVHNWSLKLDINGSSARCYKTFYFLWGGDYGVRNAPKYFIDNVKNNYLVSNVFKMFLRCFKFTFPSSLFTFKPPCWVFLESALIFQCTAFLWPLECIDTQSAARLDWTNADACNLHAIRQSVGSWLSVNAFNW